MESSDQEEELLFPRDIFKSDHEINEIFDVILKMQ